MDMIILGLTLSEAVWVPVAAALFGGVLSLAGALGATMLANRSAKKAREDEAERLAANEALIAFFKLLEGYNAAANLKRQIEDMFAAANENGDGDMEPWGRVMEIVGSDDAVETIRPSETSFLIHEEKADLLNEVLLIQRRIANILVATRKYNELRTELQTFLVANSSEAKLGEGTVMHANFEGAQKLHVEFRTSQLNSLIGQIVELLEEDVPRSWKALSNFKDARYCQSVVFGTAAPMKS